MQPGSRVLRNTRYTERFFKQTVTNATAAPSSTVAASVAFKPDKDDQPMTIRTRVAPGISAAAVSLSLALAPAAFAQDKMGKDDGMKKGDAMSKDTMKKDSMSKDAMKKDTMSKDAMKKDDGMKKDDAMKKDDGMKKN